MDLIKLKSVEKKIIKKNRNIIFNIKFKFVSNIFDLRLKIAKQQNSTMLILINKLPKIKRNGKIKKRKFNILSEVIFEILKFLYISILVVPKYFF